MCLIRPTVYGCCDRTYLEVIKIDSSCPDAWPQEKCPEDLCIIQGLTSRSNRRYVPGKCWRCQALEEGLEGESYEARRPPIDHAFVVEGIDDSSSEIRRRHAEHAGNCWFCGASSDGVRDCESCDGTGCARKGKNKAVEEASGEPAKKKKRTSSATTKKGSGPKKRKGRPPGSGKKSQLATIKEEVQINAPQPAPENSNAFSQSEFYPDIPASSYGNYSWESAGQQMDPTMPSYGMNLDGDSHAGPSGQMAQYTSNQAPLHPYNDYTVNPQQIEYSNMAQQEHLQPSIEFDQNGAHGQSQVGNVGEGVRSDENHFGNFFLHMEHNHNASYMSHPDWPDYTDALMDPPMHDANNYFAPALHDASSNSFAPVAQMTVDRFTPQPAYLPSPTLSLSHIVQHAPPPNTLAGTLASVPFSAPPSLALVAAAPAFVPLSAARLATPP